MGGTSRYTLGSHWQVNSSNKEIQPRAGKCVLFPAYVYHDAARYYGTKDRIVFSCNVSVHTPDALQWLPNEIMKELVTK